MGLREELQTVMVRYCGHDTDESEFLLAKFVSDCLNAFDAASRGLSIIHERKSAEKAEGEAKKKAEGEAKKKANMDRIERERILKALEAKEDPKVLINTEEAAKMLGISTNYLRMLQKDGPIPGRFPPPPHVRIGRRVFYRKVVVEQHIVDHEIVPGVVKNGRYDDA